MVFLPLNDLILFAWSYQTNEHKIVFSFKKTIFNVILKEKIASKSK